MTCERSPRGPSLLTCAPTSAGCNTLPMQNWWWRGWFANSLFLMFASLGLFERTTVEPLKASIGRKLITKYHLHLYSFVVVVFAYSHLKKWPTFLGKKWCWHKGLVHFKTLCILLTRNVHLSQALGFGFGIGNQWNDVENQKIHFIIYIYLYLSALESLSSQTGPLNLIWNSSRWITFRFSFFNQSWVFCICFALTVQSGCFIFLPLFVCVLNLAVERGSGGGRVGGS